MCVRFQLLSCNFVKTVLTPCLPFPYQVTSTSFDSWWFLWVLVVPLIFGCFLGFLVVPLGLGGSLVWWGLWVLLFGCWVLEWTFDPVGVTLFERIVVSVGVVPRLIPSVT